MISHPFLSLVESTDGDYFGKYFNPSGTRVYSILKIGAIMVVLVVVCSLLLDGKNDLVKLGKLTDMITMLCFLVFMAFAYKPVSHPIITTYIRATLGLGVLIFPIFIPALAAGSMRCNQMLDHSDLNSHHRTTT